MEVRTAAVNVPFRPRHLQGWFPVKFNVEGSQCNPVTSYRPPINNDSCLVLASVPFPFNRNHTLTGGRCLQSPVDHVCTSRSATAPAMSVVVVVLVCLGYPVWYVTQLSPPLLWLNIRHICIPPFNRRIKLPHLSAPTLLPYSDTDYDCFVTEITSVMRGALFTGAPLWHLLVYRMLRKAF